jgi:fructosamine-3-kinase
MSSLDARVAAALAQAIGASVTIRRRTPLGGGSINRTERIDTSAGSFVLKSNAAAPPGFFQAEADGLHALASSGTSLVIPRVIACGDDDAPFLLLEDLGVGSRARDFDERLGRGLAALHRASSARFGFPRDNFCGTTPQPNPWTDRWVELYATSRLGVQARLARDADRLSSRESAALDRLIAKLDDWIGEPPEGPALIHGDLWSGNVHVAADGSPAIIDPAAYYAHREAELGMMTLFGGFSSRVFAAYDEAFPLEPGWQDRNALYQLYHLLNHLNLFGDGYKGGVMRVVLGFSVLGSGF